MRLKKKQMRNKNKRKGKSFDKIKHFVRSPL